MKEMKTLPPVMKRKIGFRLGDDDWSSRSQFTTRVSPRFQKSAVGLAGLPVNPLDANHPEIRETLRGIGRRHDGLAAPRLAEPPRPRRKFVPPLFTTLQSGPCELMLRLRALRQLTRANNVKGPLMKSSKPKLRQRFSSRPERKLHFPWAGVWAAIEEAKTALAPLPLFGRDTGRGLWLVGDQGVYLMSNADIDKSTVVYANECDPTKLPFNTWWEAKRETFGEDDGVEFISVEEIERLVADSPTGGHLRQLVIGITPSEFTLSLLWARRKSRWRSLAVSNKSGFTLVELSIVLVIIGLIVGGIVAGRSLIRFLDLGLLWRQ
jgi:prepilin-type N-terminal cleavage/methylation domain-containing protein